MIPFYRTLLRLYPAAFRAEYEHELCAIFEARLKTSSRYLAFLGALADVIPNAVGAHFDILKQDTRYAARTLRRAPGYALTAVIVVALGVGANTAAFSLADFILLRPLPFPDSNRLLKIWSSTDQYSQNEVSPADYRDWKTMATSSFTGMAAYSPGAANLIGRGVPRRVQTARVTPELLPLIGVAPLVGSLITPANAGEGPTAVLSYGLWQSQFGGDRNALGRAVRLDGTPHLIIGVMPPNFRFPSRGTEMWTSLILQGDDFDDRTNTYLEVVARLRPGVTLEAARTELATISSRLAQQYPDSNRDVRAFAHPLRDQISRRSRLLVLALCGASLCILLLACANLGTLLLARGASRARELAIRTALGAGRDRLIRQLITETVLLGILGGLAGLVLAWAGLPLLGQLVPSTLPIDEVPKLHFRVLAFAAILVAATGLAFGVLPALRTDTIAPRQRLRSALVIAEVTGSVVLLISSGLLMRAIWRIHAIDPGFRTEQVMTMKTALPLPKYSATSARQRFYSQVVDGVRSLPGVESAAYTTGLPMVRTGGIWDVEVAGASDGRTRNPASLRYITPGYFSTLGIPLLRGRDISNGDTSEAPYVAVVSESLARRHWPDQDPLGRRFQIALKERTVVGVVGDVRVRGLEIVSEPQVYLPSGQVADNSIIGYIPQDLVVRANIPVEHWLPAVRRIVAAADPEQPISDIRPLSEVVAGNTAPRRVQLRLLMILSAIALLIAGVGIHGLLSFTVSQRTKELGIRRAIGAPASTIVNMILREGLRLALVGTAVGIVLALAAGRAMGALLFGVPPNDLQTIAVAAAICVMTALLGCLRPAIRAAQVDPMIALRQG